MFFCVTSCAAQLSSLCPSFKLWRFDFVIYIKGVFESRRPVAKCFTRGMGCAWALSAAHTCSPSWRPLRLYLSW